MRRKGGGRDERSILHESVGCLGAVSEREGRGRRMEKLFDIPVAWLVARPIEPLTSVLPHCCDNRIKGL